jgi:hypothetical protein
MHHMPEGLYRFAAPVNRAMVLHGDRLGVERCNPPIYIASPKGLHVLCLNQFAEKGIVLTGLSAGDHTEVQGNKNGERFQDSHELRPPRH